MKIMHILEPLSYGGVEKMVLYICKYLKQDNHEVHVAVPLNMYENVKNQYEGHAIIHKLDYTKSPFKACLSISKIINKISPDIIHTHARRPMVYTCMVNKHVPHVRTYHMQENENIPKLAFEYGLLRNRINRWAVTWEGIINSDLKKVKTNAPIEIIHNGVPEIVTEKVSSQTDFNLLFIGRLSKQKGLDILLNGLHLLPRELLNRIHLKIVGEGELESVLKEQTKQLGLEDTVTFEGFHSDLTPYYRECKILLMPSRYEGLPLSLIESMSTATPVAATAVGAIPTIIKNSENGWVLSENTPKSWAEFLSKIIDKENLQKVGFKAKKTYNDLFKIESMYHSYLRFYQETISK